MARPQLERLRGKYVLRDDAAGYYAEISIVDLARLVSEGAALMMLAASVESNRPKP